MTQKQKDKVSKAAFVRARPTASVDEVIAAGKAENIEISRQTVHQVRHQMRFEAKLKAKSAKRKSSKKAAKAATNGHAKAPEQVLSKYPGMRKTQSALAALEDSDMSAAALTGLVQGLRVMVRQSVRDELRTVMGGLFGPQLGKYLSQ